MRYVIGTGWWCADEHGTPAGGRHGGHIVCGDRHIRSKQFFALWSHFIKRYTAPIKVIMTDSASPVTPPPSTKAFPYEYVSLDRNYHSVKNTHYNGWLRSFINGAWYAWCCDADYLYIEQDCIVLGADWVTAAYAVARRHQLVVGSAYRSPIQQSLVFVPHNRISHFINAVLSLPRNITTCELRFHKAAHKSNGLGYALLPFGVGRARPIPWGAQHLYAQHWTVDELQMLGKREHVEQLVAELLDV